MPSQICGFNEKGESKWFDGSRLPEGWSHEDPTAKKESIPEEPVKKKDKAKTKAE